MTDVQAERAAIVSSIKRRAIQIHEEGSIARKNGWLRLAQRLEDQSEVLKLVAEDISQRGSK